MRHRHLVDGVGYTLAAIEDILDRGAPEDWVELRDLVVAEPFGPIAESVLRVCAATQMYGTSRLWPTLIKGLRLEHTAEHNVEHAPPRSR